MSNNSALLVGGRSEAAEKRFFICVFNSLRASVVIELLEKLQVPKNNRAEVFRGN